MRRHRLMHRRFPPAFIAVAFFLFPVFQATGQDDQSQIDEELRKRISEVSINEVVADFEAVVKAVGEQYVDAGYGGAEWENIVTEYRPKVASSKDAAEAYRHLGELIAALGNPLTYVVPPWFMPVQSEPEEEGGSRGIELE